jgi:hypothetical protein
MNIQKTGVFILILVACPVIASLYGALHDQLTYTISPEYYTKFKFLSFGIAPEHQNRFGVAMIGAAATWWTGLPVGLAIGLMGLIHFDAKNMLLASFRSIAVVLLVTFFMGMLGLAYGELFVSKRPPEELGGWFIPPGLTDYKNFISVGTMHNSSYLGGAMGLIAGSWWQVRQKIKMRKQRKEH